MVDKDSVPTLLSNAYETLRSVDLVAATGLLDSALALDYEDPEVLFALKCAGYWTEGLERLTGIANPFERGEYILALWKTFSGFQNRLAGDFERARYAFKRFAFSMALEQYRALPPDERITHEADLALRIGRCHKGAGNFDAAIKELGAAARDRKDDAASLAELADAYALVNETRDSKALFREAFYIDPQKIELEMLESEMIIRLMERVRELGRGGPELAEWIPVYANLFGVFTVKRELKAVEAGKLRQSIYQLENELKENVEERALLVPRLINRYFWLIDHCIAAKEDRARIEEILLKLRLLDPQIHKQYTA
jgi:tetratricopeptide (TPR) repeat protein